MSLTTWLRTLTGPTRRQRPTRFARPKLEALEERLCMDAGDTIGAALLTGLGPQTGTFSTTQDIGDGAYGGLDVDFYRIDAGTAAHLTVNQNHGEPTIMTLFDANGNWLAASYGSTLTYTFGQPQPGGYFLGVSGLPNFSYDPNMAGSGYDPAYASGTYDLTLALERIHRAPIAGPTQPVHSLNGHGTWVLNTGDYYPNHQPYIESTTIHAWLDADGTAHGTIIWMDTFNGPNDLHGKSYSGYTWQVQIDTYIINVDGSVYVEGVIVHSNVQSDIGNRNGFTIYDGGAGELDLINYGPLLAGNFTIQ